MTFQGRRWDKEAVRLFLGWGTEEGLYKTMAFGMSPEPPDEIVMRQNKQTNNKQATNKSRRLLGMKQSVVGGNYRRQHRARKAGTSPCSLERVGQAGKGGMSN